MPNSMTGFSRQEEHASWGNVSCEIRSVNHRYLEPLIRLPESLRSIETYIRDQCRKKLNRGKVEVVIGFSANTLPDKGLAVNMPLVNQLVGALEQVSQTIKDQGAIAAPIDPLRLLQWPEVIESQGVDIKQVQSTACSLVDKALGALIAHRQREGLELQAHIEQRLVSIGEVVERVREHMPEVLQAHHERLKQRLDALKIDIDKERFAQEVALLANKADVEEELDRLDTHILEVRHILEQKEAIGRRLDFMMQELNREANTLSSKAIHSDTTQVAVSLKVFIEQMREQIQNIE